MVDSTNREGHGFPLTYGCSAVAPDANLRDACPRGVRHRGSGDQRAEILDDEDECVGFVPGARLGNRIAWTQSQFFAKLMIRTKFIGMMIALLKRSNSMMQFYST